MNILAVLPLALGMVAGSQILRLGFRRTRAPYWAGRGCPV
jgi:hypothetical protein